jgi:transposase InsO family protein
VPKKRKRRGHQPTEAELVKRNGPVPFDIRVRIIQAVMRGTKHNDVAVAFGVSPAVVQKFVGLFESGGIEALRLRVSGAAVAGAKRLKKEGPLVDQVLAMKEANPDWGARRISDVLARFEGLGISYSSAHRILREAGLVTPMPGSTDAREHPPRRFERAEPNQLWQSDIFQFELRRHQPVYMVGFMDDYSRYLVSWGMAHHHKSSLVIDALERGIAEYGEPKEVLTDQGRQYVAWRGETEFQRLLQRRGIEHAKSRPQHPETLGKIERFWKTLWNEFLRKTVFADFADCLRRVELFIQHYNFQRTSQAIDGHVPADRYFRAAPHVRAAVETQIKANALRLAQAKEPQKPFYLVGRLGDQDLSIAASGGALRVQVGDAAQTIPMSKEHTDETKASRVFPLDEAANQASVSDDEGDREARRAAAPAAAAQLRNGDETQASTVSEEDDDETQANTHDSSADSDEEAPTLGPQAWHSALADGPQGSGRGRAATNDPDPLGAVGPDAGDDGDRRARDFAAALLSARDEGGGRDDAGAGTWSERGVESRRRDADASNRRARTQDLAIGAGQPSPGASPALGEEGIAAGTDRNAGETPEETWPSLDERWARTFACLEEDDDRDAIEPDFDPDDGWRDRAMMWHRKLAGADAPIEADADGESAGAQRTVDVREPTRGASGAEATLRSDPSGDRRADDDQRRGEGTRYRASEHAGASAPGGGSDHRGAAAASDGTDASAAGAEEARGSRRGIGEAERQALPAADGSRRHDDGGRRDHPQPARTTAGVLEDLVVALEALAQETAERRGRLGAGASAVDSETGTESTDDDPS